MDVEFRNTNGERVGFIIGSDVKDNYGNRVGYIIDGKEVRDTHGNRAGIYNGSDIRDNYGNRIGYLNGNEIRDNYGNRVGYPTTSASEIEKVAAAFLLFGLTAETASNQTATQSPEREKPKGIWAFLAFIFLPFFELRYSKYPATRMEWWGTLVRMFVFFFVFALLLNFIGVSRSNNAIVQLVSILLMIGLPMTPIIVVSIRRMRDIGKAWWWILIPLVNFVMCGFFPGK